jgi:RNA polymerase sporulation-specific sigma factor
MSDRDLIVRAKSDPEAANRFVRQMEPLALSAARGLFVAGADREDIVQEARIGIAAAIRSFDPWLGVPVNRFVWVCVRRHLVTCVKQANAQKHRSLTKSRRLTRDSEGETQEAVLGLPARGHHAGDPAGIFTDMETLASYAETLRDRLSELERHVTLGLAEGLSYQQVADRHGVGVKAVDNARVRARDKFSAAA